MRSFWRSTGDTTDAFAAPLGHSLATNRRASGGLSSARVDLSGWSCAAFKALVISSDFTHNVRQIAGRMVGAASRSRRDISVGISFAGGLMDMRDVGLIVLYRWRLHPGMETSFVEAWSRISALLRSQRGSLGSRLHRGSDGIWYSYAQWPSAEARERAFEQPHVDAEASEQMRAAVAERFPEVVLDAVADFLVFSCDQKGS